jgi:cell division protein FtsZ
MAIKKKNKKIKKKITTTLSRVAVKKKKIKLGKKPIKVLVAKKNKKIKKKVIKKVIKKKPAKSRRHLGGPVKIAPKARFVGKPAVHRTSTKIKKSKKREIKTEEFPAEALFKAKIKVVGVGGGGGSIVSEIGRSLQKATFVVADTDVRALRKKAGIKYFLFGQELTHGLGTGLNIDLAKKSAESAKGKISNIFKDQDIVIFIASLGGGLGSGATQVFAEMAKEFGGITLGIFTMPFKFEGANKYRIAQNALKSLRQSLNVSLVIPNEKIFKVIDSNTAITDAFSMVNKSLIESLESLIDLIYSPGIINIDFADLRAILSGIGNSAFLNTIEESGKDRAEKICQRILINPLLQNSTFEVEKILLNVAGSSNLSMLEVEKISRKVAELNPKAKIIFGISKENQLKNKIKTTILMTGGGTEVELEEIKPEIVEMPEQEKREPVKKPFGFVKVEKKKVKAKPAKSRRHLGGPVKIVQKARFVGKPKPARKKPEKKEKEQEKIEPIVEVPVFPAAPVSLNIIEQPAVAPMKTAIRRSGLEIKKAEELQEKKRQEQEKEWEIPAFLRKVKYNK